MSYPLRSEYLIGYDITDNRLRTHTYKELSNYGLTAVQKSVFWGYLTFAELNAIKRYFNDTVDKYDKVFITHTHFNSRGQSFFIGHDINDFVDWEESSVI